MTPGYLLGIDLGTTWTAAATCRAGARPPTPRSSTLAPVGAVPSVLFVGEDGSVVVGEAAERRATTDPDRVVREFKRRIGDATPIIVGGRPGPEELAARLVRWVADRVAEREGGRPRASRSPTRRPGARTRRTCSAPRCADGLPVTFLAEPQAAALHYAAPSGWSRAPRSRCTTSAAAPSTRPSCTRTRRGSACSGRPEGIERLGGIDLDELVFEHVRRGPAGGARARRERPGRPGGGGRVRRECTEAKEALSSDTEVTIPVLLPWAGGRCGCTAASSRR